jgi:peptidyl carrier protein
LTFGSAVLDGLKSRLTPWEPTAQLRRDVVTRALSEEDVSARLMAFIREKFLAGDPRGELEESSPLLEWGILNSLNTAVLLTHIRQEFAMSIPLEKIDARVFRDVRSITSMLCEVSARSTA